MTNIQNNLVELGNRDHLHEAGDAQIDNVLNVARPIFANRKLLPAISGCHRFWCWVASWFYSGPMGHVEAYDKKNLLALEGLFRRGVAPSKIFCRKIIDECGTNSIAAKLVRTYFDGFEPALQGRPDMDLSRVSTSVGSSSVHSVAASILQPAVNLLELHQAIQNLDIEKAIRLAEAGPGGVNHPNPEGQTPLHLACNLDRYALADKLLLPPLRRSASKEKADQLIKQLIQALRARGASLAAQDAQGRTPLHLAIERELPQAAYQHLLEDSVDIADHEGLTPLDRLMAQLCPSLPFACRLIRAGARTNIVRHLAALFSMQRASGPFLRSWYLKEILGLMSQGDIRALINEKPALQHQFLEESIDLLPENELMEALKHITAVPDDAILLRMCRYKIDAALWLLPKIQNFTGAAEEVVHHAGTNPHFPLSPDHRFALAKALLAKSVMHGDAAPLLTRAAAEGRTEDLAVILVQLKDYIKLEDAKLQFLKTFAQTMKTAIESGQARPGDATPLLITAIGEKRTLEAIRILELLPQFVQKDAVVQLAAKMGDYEVLVRCLNADNAYIVTNDGEKNTLLHLAVMGKSTVCINLVVQYFDAGKINVENSHGKTALSLTYNGKIEAILKNHGATSLLERTAAAVKHKLNKVTAPKKKPLQVTATASPKPKEAPPARDILDANGYPCVIEGPVVVQTKRNNRKARVVEITDAPAAKLRNPVAQV